MKKTILYRLFGFGKVPVSYRPALESEGIILSDEGLPGTVTYRDFRGGGRYSNWKRQWYTASITLTGARLLAFRHSSPIIDVPVADERFRALAFSLEDEDTLLVAYDASLFHADWSGKIEYRFRTPLAPAFLDKLRARQTA